MKDILIYIGSKYSKSGDIIYALDTLKDFKWATLSGRPNTPVINSITNKMDPIDKRYGMQSARDLDIKNIVP